MVWLGGDRHAEGEKLIGVIADVLGIVSKLKLTLIGFSEDASENGMIKYSSFSHNLRIGWVQRISPVPARGYVQT